MRDFVSEIIDRVSDQIRVLDSTLTSGTGVHNMEHYKNLLGKREGLQIALNEINDILTENDEAE